MAKTVFIFSHQGFQVQMEAIPRVICRAHSTIFLIMTSETTIEQKNPAEVHTRSEPKEFQMLILML